MTTASPTIAPQELIAALKLLSSFDFGAALAAFESQNTEAKVDEGLLVAEDVAEVMGYGIPAAATAAQWIALVRVALPYLVWANEQLPAPQKLGPNEYMAFGSVFER